MKNWKTSLFGTIAGLATGAHAAGVSVGHLGSVDFVAAIGSISTMLAFWFAKDRNVTGGTNPQDGGTIPATNMKG